MIRFGVVGTNWITEEFIRCAKLLEEFELVAVYSRMTEKADEFAKKHSASFIFTDLETMAKSKEIDAVYIASPNSCHAVQAQKFLHNKKHVLCEKPIASNINELNNMIKAAKDNEVLLMEALKTTFLPNFKAIKENLHKIGKIRRYNGIYCQYSSRYDLYKANQNPNTFNPEFSNGSLMDIGIYCLYPAIFLFGKPNFVNSTGLLLNSGVDGQGSLNLSYDDMEAIIMHSKIANSELKSEIQGENGTILIDKISAPEKVEIFYRDGSVEEITVDQSKDTMYYEIKAFVDLIKTKKIESDVNSFELSIRTMEVLDLARSQIGVVYPADLK